MIHARNSRRPAPASLAQPSELEEAFEFQIRALQLPRPQRELRLHPTRKWRYDFVWLDMRLVVEIEGHVHRIRERFEADFEKYAWLTLEGYTLLRIGGRQVRSGVGVTWLQRLVWERAPLGCSKAYTGGEARQPATVLARTKVRQAIQDQCPEPVDNPPWAAVGSEVYES